MKMPPLDFSSLLQGLAGYGDRTALDFYVGRNGVGRLSYAELVRRVDTLAGALRSEYGVTVGDRVAILAPNRIEVPVLMLALMRLGAVAVPLNPALSAVDWAYILGHSRARGICATRELFEQAGAGVGSLFEVPLEDLFELEDSPRHPPLPAPEKLADAPAVVLYTSGTTGGPKGVTLRQRNLIANAWSMARNFHLEGTTQLAVLPLYHAHAFGFGLMTALTTGGHLVFTERLDPFNWAAVIRAENVEVTSVVPTLLPMLLAAGVKREQVPSLRHIMVSSAPLPTAVAREFEERTGIRLVHGWGLSEYTNFACCADPGESAEDHARGMFSEDVPSVGPAIEGTEVRVTNADGKAAAEGERGELWVRGHSTMHGYLDDPAATNAVLDADGWLRTGDEGFFRDRGGQKSFFVTGRIKELIIRDAEKYSPIKLERTLTSAVPELAGVLAIVGYPHDEHGEEIGGYLHMPALDAGLKKRIEDAVRSLPVAEQPKVILHGAEPIPRTHTGKVQRRKMQQWFQPWSDKRGPLVLASLK